MSSHALEAARAAAAAGHRAAPPPLPSSPPSPNSLSAHALDGVARPSKSAKFILKFFAIWGLTATDDDDNLAVDDDYADMRSLRSEVDAQGGRTAALSEVLVAVAQAGWEGEGEGG